MKKVYILYNCEINEVMAVSEDKDLINEIMCDYFIEDVEYEWFWRTQFNSSLTDNLSEVAKDVWYDTLNWYDMETLIFEEEVI